MQISSIVDIVGGELLNSPSISFITQIHTIANKINEGDLFIATCQEDIDEALSNGAFAIVFDFECWMNDTEVAWIKVTDIKLSAIKLLRFLLSNHTIKSYYCDDVSFNLLNLFSTKESKSIFLSDNILIDFELVVKDIDIEYIFSTNKNYIQTLLPQTTNFDIKTYSIDNLTKHSLFSTTFSYKEQLFSRLSLPSLYINQFIGVYEFYNNSIDTTKLKKLNSFVPIFINKNSEIVEFGKSNKFIISSLEKNNNEIKFLKEEYDYATIEIITNFKNNLDLYNQIKTLQVNAIYIIGKSNEEIQNLLEKFMKDSLSLSF